MRYEFTEAMCGDPNNIAGTLIDIESTGLHTSNNDEMVEVSFVTFDKELQPVKVIDYWFTPLQKFSPTSTQNAVGLSMIEIITRSKNMTILDHLSEFLRDLNEAQAAGDIVAHNAAFDTRFIQSSLLRFQESFVFQSNKVKDSQNMFRRVSNEKTNLDNMLKILDLSVEDVKDYIEVLGMTGYNRHTGVFDCIGVLMSMGVITEQLGQPFNYGVLK